MSYISKINTNFLNYMNKKYREYDIKFEFWDDYALWLFYDYKKENSQKYYKQLEKDIWEYVEFQIGAERTKRGKINGQNQL